MSVAQQQAQQALSSCAAHLMYAPGCCLMAQGCEASMFSSASHDLHYLVRMKMLGGTQTPSPLLQSSLATAAPPPCNPTGSHLNSPVQPQCQAISPSLCMPRSCAFGCSSPPCEGGIDGEPCLQVTGRLCSQHGQGQPGHAQAGSERQDRLPGHEPPEGGPCVVGCGRNHLLQACPSLRLVLQALASCAVPSTAIMMCCHFVMAGALGADLSRCWLAARGLSRELGSSLPPRCMTALSIVQARACSHIPQPRLAG